MTRGSGLRKKAEKKLLTNHIVTRIVDDIWKSGINSMSFKNIYLLYKIVVIWKLKV